MITINVEQSILPDKQKLSKDLIKRVEKAVNSGIPIEKHGVIEVAFVSEVHIQRLNRMHRGKDSITDVLSFEYPDQTDIIGDVAICYAQAERQAHGDVAQEVLDLLVHGILHVLGYDHEKPGQDKIMFSLQDKIVDSLL